MTDLEVMQRRQRALADFGDFALQSEDLDAVLTEACRLVGEALGTGRAKVLEIEPGGQSLFVRAGVGWAPDVVGQVHVPMGENSSESFSIALGEPVITQDIRKDDRYDVPPFMKAAGVVALANVPIFLSGRRAYGLLQVDDTRPRDFDRNDTEFLRTYASLLGPVIDRLFKLRELGAVERRQNFLLTLSDALRAQSGVDAVVEVAARLLGEHLGASRVLFAEFDYARGVADIFNGWFADGAAPFPTVMRLEDYEGPILHDLRAGRTVRVDDATDPALARPDLAAIATVGVKALLSVPLLVEGRLRVNLSVHQHDLRRWTDEEVALVQEVAERLWADLVRARAEGALREAEARYRTDLERQVEERTAELGASRDLLQVTMDSSTDMIQVFKALRDERGEIVDFRWVLNNHTAERVYGRVEGESLLERNPGVVVEGIFDAFKRVTETGQPEQAESHYVHEQFDGWFLQSVVKLDDGVATTTKDITDWKRAQEELLRLRDEVAQARIRESEERLAAIFVNASVGLSELALDGRFLEVNEELCRLLGRKQEDLLRLSVPEVTHSEDVPASRQALADALAGAGPVSLDKRYQRPDGTVVWANSRVSLLRHGEGRPDTLLAVTVNLTERRAAEEAVRESEARFRQFGDASGDVLWIRNAETLEFEYVSPAVEEVYGTPPEDLLAGNQMLRWAGMILPEDREKALDAIRRIRAGEHVLNTFRFRRRGDGAVRWIRDNSFPLLDAEGRVQRIGGIGHDATEEIELQDRLKVLVAELQHRTRNLMGVVRSVTDKTLSSSTSLEDFGGRIRDRLNALARVNGLLSRLDGGRRITFDELLRTELMAHGVMDPDEPGSQVMLGGPEGIRLRSSTVQTLALGLHELATNALKYGALSRPEGRLSVTWNLVDGPEGEPRLRVDWSESGVPVLTVVPDGASGGAPTAPRRRGYGRELIERALPYQLKAETSYELTPQGLRCRITLPVSSTMGRAQPVAREEPDA